MRVLGLINARGGSKGIPGKNFKPLLGRPLIVYAIEAGLGAAMIDHVVVSTDHPEIAEIARAAGADVPFLRPPELAGDETLQIDVIVHAVEWLRQQGDEFDVVCLMQPTCPLRLPADIDGALELLERERADTVISVTDVGGMHPLTYYTGPESGELSALLESGSGGVLRQQFPTVWWRNGAIYAIRTAVVMRRSLYGDRVFGYPMPRERSANVDEPLDWVLAEAMMRHLGYPDLSAEMS